MALTYAQLREEVLALPSDQQLEIADTVYCCTEPAHPSELHPAWAEELRRRSEDFRSGKTKGIPWEEVKGHFERLTEGR